MIATPRKGPCAKGPASTQPTTKEAAKARKHAMALFRAVQKVEYQDGESQWNAVLEFLNLPLCYQPAIKLALADGRWRRAANPKAYVATVAYRIAINEHLFERPIDAETLGRDKSEVGPISNVIVDRGYEDGRPMSDEDYMDRMWSSYGDWGDFDWGVIPDWLRAFGDRHTLVDWNRVAECAVRKDGMADAVSEVLQLKAIGIPRDAALRAARNDRHRDRLQAAWRWVDRNWESRIVPLFHQHHPPRPVPVPAAPARNKASRKQEGRLVPPWEVLQKISQRPRRRETESFPAPGSRHNML